MDTVVLTIDNPQGTTKNQRTFGEIIVRLFTFWIPRASPDYETNLDNVKYWYIEVDKNSGTPQREIGFDNINRAILFAPTDKNYGLWTDSPVNFTWTEHTTVDKEVFNDIFEALEKHDFKIIENKIKKYQKLWTENPDIKKPELPVLICNLDSMTDFLHCKTYEQLLDVDVMGYEWEEQKLIDKTGAVYTTDYINFGHPVGCVIPKKIEIILSFDDLKKKAADRFKKSEIEINDSKTFEQIFELLEKVS
jgi:hypothetical protein